MRKLMAAAACAAVVGLGSAAIAKEYPIGKPHKVAAAGMEVAAVYLQPIEMAPPGMMRAAKDSDIHLEADIKALKGNKNGYAAGTWIGYLAVTYELTKVGEGETLKGELMPMVANDGPHYGDNVKMLGPGGDVRDSVSGEEGGTPTVAAKHTTEHPHVTASCNDHKSTDGV